MEEEIKILVALGCNPPKSVVVLDDGEYEDSPEEMRVLGKTLARYMMNNVPANFCDGFAEEWSDWHKSYCVRHKTTFNYCKKNILNTDKCDSCEDRFNCYTEPKLIT